MGNITTTSFSNTPQATSDTYMSSATGLTAYVDSGLLHLGVRALVAARLVDVRAPRIDAARMPKPSPVAASGTPRSRGAGLVAVPSAVAAGSVGDPAREEAA